MIRQCQRMITESCREAVALATYPKDKIVDYNKAREKDEEAPCRMGSPNVSSSLESEKSARKRMRSEEEAAAGKETVPCKKWRSNRQTASSTDYRYLFGWMDHAICSLDKVLIVAGGFDDQDCFLDIIQNIDNWVTDVINGVLDVDQYQRNLLANNLGQGYFMHGRRSISAITLPDAFPTVATPMLEFEPASAISRLSYDDPESRRLMATYQSPLIIQDSLGEWPAISKWKSPNYWHQKTIHGRRVVPVELGNKYTDEKWRMDFMRFQALERNYMLRKSSSHKQDEPALAYLAQHDIFAQIPSLQKDIKIPDECYIPIPESYVDPPNLLNSDPKRPIDGVEKSIWMGPAGTVSPLHYDPYHNTLCQVVGTKYVRLYAPEETPQLYHKEGLLHNTSQVDVEAPKEVLGKDFPNFLEAKYVEGYLRAGEMLWLPKGWWHYVRGVETSISVSFWWS